MWYIVYKAFHSLVPVCLASLFFSSFPRQPHFYPHQTMCSFLNTLHSYSPVPLLILGPPPEPASLCSLGELQHVLYCVTGEALPHFPLLLFSSPTEFITLTPCFHGSMFLSVLHHFFFRHILLLLIVYISVTP